MRKVLHLGDTPPAAVGTLYFINDGLHAFAAIMSECDDVLNTERFHRVRHSRIPSRVQLCAIA